MLLHFSPAFLTVALNMLDDVPPIARVLASKQAVASADDVFSIGSHQRACDTKKTGSASKNFLKKTILGELSLISFCIFINNKILLL